MALIIDCTIYIYVNVMSVLRSLFCIRNQELVGEYNEKKSEIPKIQNRKEWF